MRKNKLTEGQSYTRNYKRDNAILIIVKITEKFIFYRVDGGIKTEMDKVAFQKAINSNWILVEKKDYQTF